MYKKQFANIDLIKEKIGWEPKIMLEKWIEDIIVGEKFDEI